MQIIPQIQTVVTEYPLATLWLASTAIRPLMAAIAARMIASNPAKRLEAFRIAMTTSGNFWRFWRRDGK